MRQSSNQQQRQHGQQQQQESRENEGGRGGGAGGWRGKRTVRRMVSNDQQQQTPPPPAAAAAGQQSNSSPSSGSSHWRRGGKGKKFSDHGPSTSRQDPFHGQLVPQSGPALDADEDDWGEMDPTYWDRKEKRSQNSSRRGSFESRVGQGAALEFVSPVIPNQTAYVNCLRAYMDPINSVTNDLSNAMINSDEDANSSKDSGLAETDDSTCGGPWLLRGKVGKRKEERDKRAAEEDDERTTLAKLKVYSNDLLMEHIISHITLMSDRSRVELASSRMFDLSKNAPYRFTKGGDHLNIHFTTFDDFATIEYGSVVRTVPVLTMDTRRFDAMRPEMTIALRRILDNIAVRFAKQVRAITLGGTNEFYAARGVPFHHLVITYDLLEYVLRTFPRVTEIHLKNCGFDDGALDFCDTDLWKQRVAQMETVELKTVWADTHTRLPVILNSLTSNLQQFTLTRFKCKRMGAALLQQMRRANCRLKEVELVIDEDTADDPEEMVALLKEVDSRAESVRITVAEVGDGRAESPICFKMLQRIREVTNLTELKVYVKPKCVLQFEALVGLIRDLELLPRLRTLHLEGFADQQWTTPELIGSIEQAVGSGLRIAGETLEDISVANFPKPTKSNAAGFRENKEEAYRSLWLTLSRSIGTARTKRIKISNMRMEDDYLRTICNRLMNVEEVYLWDLRRTTARSVQPLVGGEFQKMRRLEAEIPVDPMVLYKLADVRLTPQLQYAKLGLKHRITTEDHHMKLLQSVFQTVFLDQDAPRGPIKQFVEVHNRIPGAEMVQPSRKEMQQQLLQRRSAVRPDRATISFDQYMATANRAHRAKQPARNLYGEWE